MKKFTLKFWNTIVAFFKLMFHFLINISDFFKLSFNAIKVYSKKEYTQIKVYSFKKYAPLKDYLSKKYAQLNKCKTENSGFWGLIFSKHNTIIKYIIIAFLWFLYFNLNSWEPIIIKSLKIDFTPFSDFLQGNKKIDLLFCIFILIVFVVYFLTRINDHRYYSRFKHFILALSLYPLISATWTFSNSINIPFFYFIYALCFFAAFELFHSTFRLYHLISKKPNLNNDNTGFIIDAPLEDNDVEISTNRIEYAKQLATRLQNTDIKKHAFAVGIVGSWGHGKSSFLKLIIDELQNESIIIKFNPWYSNTKDQIIADFFDTLKGDLSKYNPALSKSFSKYANALSDAIDSKPIAKFNKIIQFWNKNSDLKDLYEKVSNEICKINKRIYIIIDDLDRLEKSEIMEVLRLIRNTASFKNTIFIVGYDREYIIDSIKSHGLTSATQYLEKIFSVEISLPSYEKDIIVNELLAQLLNVNIKTNTSSITRYISSKTDFKGDYIISSFLYNLRDIKRFVNMFSLNLNSYYPEYEADIFPLNLFLIELIKYRFFPIYTLLRDKPNYIFSKNTYEEKYLFQEPNTDDSSIKSYNTYGDLFNRIEKFITIDICDNDKEIIFIILKLLLSNKNTNKRQSICFTQNYQKYFAYRLMDYNISVEEFIHSKSSFDKLKLMVDKCFDLNNLYKINSILMMIESNKSLSIEEFKTVFDCFIYIGTRIVRHSIYFRVSKSLFLINTDSEIQTKIYIDSLITSEINIKKLFLFSDILNYLFDNEDHSEDETRPVQFFIYDNNEIIKLLKEIFIKAIKTCPNISSLFDSKSIYSNILENCIVTIYSYDYDPRDNNFVIDELIDYIKNQDDSAQFLMNSFNPKFDGDEYANEQILLKVQIIIKKYFGSISAYQNLISECKDFDVKLSDSYFEKLDINH